MTTAGAIRAGRAFVELFTDDTKLVRGLRAASARVKAFGRSVGNIGASMMQLGTLAIAPMLGAAKLFASMGDSMAKMAKRTGFSVEALSGLTFAASQSGTSIEALEKGIKRMQMTIVDAGRGLSTAVDALAMLGLAYQDLAGMSPEAQFKLIADRLSSITDATEKAAIANMLFGRAGTAMLPMIAGGSKGLEEFYKQAAKLGLIISTEAAEGAEKFASAMDVAGRVVKMTAFNIGQSLVPTLMQAVQWIVDTSKEVSKWVNANNEMVASILKWVASILALGAVLWVFSKLIAIFGGLIAVVRGAVVAFTFLAAHPVVAAFVAITALVSGLIYLFSSAADKAKDLEDQWKVILELEEQSLAAEKKRKADIKEAVARRKEREADTEYADYKKKKEEEEAVFKRLQAAMREEELKRIEDVHDREMQRIKDKYAEERKLAGNNVDAQIKIDLVESEAFKTVDILRARKIADEKAKAVEADRMRQEEIAADERALFEDELNQIYEIRKLEIERDKTGLDRTLALLDIEEERALLAAAAAGTDLDLITRRFDIERQLAKAAVKTDIKAAADVTRGTFLGERIGGLAMSSLDARKLKAAEEAARRLKNIDRKIQQARFAG